MKRWTEGYVHIKMRDALRTAGFQLIAGEYPGGSDHELYPLNVTDPTVARDGSPDPRRHSAGELIPDIVALHDRFLVLGEAKVDYNEPDRRKLEELVNGRRDHLYMALIKFSQERGFPELLPVETLTFLPTLIFTNRKKPPMLPLSLSYMILSVDVDATYLGPMSEVVSK